MRCEVVKSHLKQRVNSCRSIRPDLSSSKVLNASSRSACFLAFILKEMLLP